MVHWNHTTSRDAFIGKYSLEMVKDVRCTSRKRRRKNLPNTSTLTLDNVDILVYDFSLTKTGHLRQTTIKIIKEKIPNVAPDTTQRQTRSMSHNHGEVGLQFRMKAIHWLPVMMRMRPHKALLVHQMGLKMMV